MFTPTISPKIFFPDSVNFDYFQWKFVHVDILVSFVQMLAFLDATNNSLYSGCSILSNSNAILSTSVSVLLSILILNTHLRGCFVLTFWILQLLKKLFERQNHLLINSTRILTLCGVPEHISEPTICFFNDQLCLDRLETNVNILACKHVHHFLILIYRT